jgi:4-diphosphocytidyl-2-C-methyl-D-erythritol kinase
MKIRIKSYAKINPFLAVGEPLESGYHPVRTILQTISLHDILEMEVADVESFECIGATLESENTVTKALRLLSEKFSAEAFRIKLEKQIPIEAGLGGGSSNAAAVIRGVYAWHNQKLDDFALDVAKAIGVDVAFFLRGGTARGEGFGEIVTPIGGAPHRYGLIVKPEEGISTREAYRTLDAAPREFKEFPRDSDDFWNQNSLYNDFERVAPCVCGEIAERLRIHGAESSLLSGSGSAVFGIFSDKAILESAKEKIDKEFEAEVLPFETIDDIGTVTWK